MVIKVDTPWPQKLSGNNYNVKIITKVKIILLILQKLYKNNNFFQVYVATRKINTFRRWQNHEGRKKVKKKKWKCVWNHWIERDNGVAIFNKWLMLFFYYFFSKYFFGVSHLANCIFLFVYNEPELGVGINPGMALTPLPSSIGRGLNLLIVSQVLYR